MTTLLAIPHELFSKIMEQLLDLVGPYKLLRLRAVSKIFNASIIHTVFETSLFFPSRCTNSHMRTLYKLCPPLAGRLLRVRARQNGDNEKQHRLFAATFKAVRAIGGFDEAIVNEEDELAVCTAIAAEIQERGQMGVVLDGQNPPVSDNGERWNASSALCAAIAARKTKLFSELLPTVEDVNQASPYFGLPLKLAALYGQKDIVEKLLAAGANPGILDPDENAGPAVLWAVHFRPGSYWGTRGGALRAACLGGHQHIAELLLAPEHRLERAGEEFGKCVITASRSGNARLVRHLLEIWQPRAEENVDWLKLEVFWAACWHGRDAVVVMMTDDYKVNVNALLPEYTLRLDALQLAASGGYVGTILHLVSCGANPSYSNTERRGTALIAAVQNGHEEAVRTLVAASANPDVAGTRWSQLLIEAARAGQARVIKLLLELGADPHKIYHPITRSTIGQDALLTAVSRGLTTCVQVLVESGAAKLTGLGHLRSSLQPMLVALSKGLDYMVDLLLHLGAQEVDPLQSPLAEGFRVGRLPERREITVGGFGVCSGAGWQGGIPVTRETREWVGKY